MRRKRPVAACRPLFDRRGMVLALTAILTPVVVGVMAMALDAGVMYLQRRQAQSAADAASLAGAYAIYNGSNFSTAQSTAVSVAMHNGFTIPTSYVTQPSPTQVAVKISSNPPRFFSALWGKGNLEIAASATSQASSSSSGTVPYSKASVVLLNPSASGSLYLAGSAQVHSGSCGSCGSCNSNSCGTCGSVGCGHGGGCGGFGSCGGCGGCGGIQVNSSNQTAVIANNAGGTAADIDVVGGYITSSGGYLSGRITTGVSSAADPLASISAPSDPGSSCNQDAYMKGYPGWGSYTMQPGQYTSDVNLGNGGTFTMAPGLYYFKNGANLTIANGARLTGSGVTIYTQGGGTINFEGGTTTTLSAPGSSSNGTIQGMVYMQDRTSTTAPNFANGTSVNLSGTFYAAKAPLVFAGGNLSNFASQVVVDSMNLSNDAQITVNYSASNVPSKPAPFNYPVTLIQ